MKKLIIIIAAIAVTSCQDPIVKGPLTVYKIEANKFDPNYKYRIVLGQEDDHLIIYTNIPYSIGDTLK